MFGGGLEILSEGDDFDAGGLHISQGLVDFRFRFAEAEHNAGFRNMASIGGVFEDFEATFVFGLDAYGFLEPLNRFDIVVENVRGRFKYGVDLVEVAFEIGGEDFDRSARIPIADGANGGGPDRSSSIGEFVAGDGSDDAMAQVHLGHGIGDASGFAQVEFGRTSRLNRAKVARARANIAENHNRSGSSRPAFAHVWALGALANGVELIVIDHPAYGSVTFAAGKFGSKPLRLSRFHPANLFILFENSTLKSKEFVFLEDPACGPIGAGSGSLQSGASRLPGRAALEFGAFCWRKALIF